MLNPVIFTRLFNLFLIIKISLKFLLAIKNINFIKKHLSFIPYGFENFFTLEEHQKAGNYTMTKLKFSLVSLSLDLVITILLFHYGALRLINDWILTYQYSTVVTGLLLFFVLGAISFILELPFDLYNTFVIEERFGFNKTTPKIFITDLFKKLFLSIIIGLPLLYLLLTIMDNLPNSWWFWGWALLTIFQLLLMWIYPVLIAPLFNKFQSLTEGDLKTTIDALLSRTNLYFKDIQVMDASKRSAHGNAYFTGFLKNKRIVFFDTLIKSLTNQEIEAVLAHELGHFKHKHILKSMIITIFFSLLGFFIMWKLSTMNEFFVGHYNQIPSNAMALLIFSNISSIYLFPLTPVFTYFSRKNEFEADRFAKTYSNSHELINALLKLYKENSSTLTPDPLYSLFYYSHPPASERILALRK